MNGLYYARVSHIYPLLMIRQIGVEPWERIPLIYGRYAIFVRMLRLRFEQLCSEYVEVTGCVILLYLFVMMGGRL